MASEKLFEGTPPFSDDVPTASMFTISLTNLISGDESTAESMLKACRSLGFFMLDLRGNPLGEAMIKGIDHLFGVMHDLMQLSDEVKEEYKHDIPRSFLGFKPRGIARTETGAPDRCTFFNLGADALLGTAPPQAVPPLLLCHRAVLASFLAHGRTIVSRISRTLALQLGLPAETFDVLQDPSLPSGTVVRMIHAAASPEAEERRTSMIHHTDFGTVTLLANVLGGLQVLAPREDDAEEGEERWEWVKPQQGCLVVNLGDAMVEWTGGVLRSNVHRVYCPPGAQRLRDRYSLAILVRPFKEARMRSLVGGGKEDGAGEDRVLKAWEWEVQKAMALKRDDDVVKGKAG